MTKPWDRRIPREKPARTVAEKLPRARGRPRRSGARLLWLRRAFAGLLLLALLSFAVIPFTQDKSTLAARASAWLDDYHYRHLPAFGIRMPTRYKIHGIDVSRYQGRIDWEKVASMESDDIRIRFVFIKASEGMLLIDPHFRRNWKESKEHGLLRGAYHYFKPHVNGKVQARHFLRTVRLEEGDLPPVVDVEENGRLSPEKLRERLGEWLKVVEEETGVRPLIYTGLNFYQHFLEGYFEDYPFWIAHYHHSRPRLKGSHWLFWQHSDAGRVEGISHKVDFNVFSGKEESLLELCLPTR